MSIDVRSWHREGRLRPGPCFAHSLTWMWEPTEEIGVLTKADAVYLMFRSRSWQGEYGPTIKQRIPIVWTPCTLGGDLGFVVRCAPIVGAVAGAWRSFTALVSHSHAATAINWPMPLRTRRRFFASSGGPGRSGCV